MTARPPLVTLGRPLGAALLLGLLALVGLSAVAVGWADLAAATAERDAKADQLERGAAAGRRGGPAKLATPAADPFVAADSPTLAAARVDADLRTLAAASGLSLRASRAEVKPAETAGTPDPWTRIEVQASVEGQNDALQAFLVKLETGLPVVLVDGLSVEPAEAEAGGAADPQAPRLHASLTLAAFWRPSQKPGTAAAPPTR